MKRHIKRKKVCYVGVILPTYDIKVSTSKSAIASFLGISVDTIRRRMTTSSIYISDKYIIWYDVEIETIRGGFALK